LMGDQVSVIVEVVRCWLRNEKLCKAADCLYTSRSIGTSKFSLDFFLQTYVPTYLVLREFR
jgi:hypothetical protein